MISTQGFGPSVYFLKTLLLILSQKVSQEDTDKSVFNKELPRNEELSLFSNALEWDQQTALDNLMHKGGWEGEIAEEDRKEVRVERYEVDRLVLSYKVGIVNAFHVPVFF